MGATCYFTVERRCRFGQDASALTVEHIDRRSNKLEI